ncbi:MAG: hypothetical protein V4604_00360 [Bacteroidota bacterium]
MKKTIAKHIERRHVVKIFLVDDLGDGITNFTCVILEQNDEFILVADTYDFKFTGLTMYRKKDITEILYSDNQKYMEKIILKEGRIDEVILRRQHYNFELGSLKELLDFILENDLAFTAECKYESRDDFYLGTLDSVKNKKFRMNYINADGRYDYKPVTIRFEDVTTLTIDNEYANWVRKYAFKQG